MSFNVLVRKEILDVLRVTVILKLPHPVILLAPRRVGWGGVGSYSFMA